MQLRITNAGLWRPGSLATILALAVIGFAATGLSNVANAAKLSAGDDQTCAVSEGGGVKCWGNNRFSGLGDGTFLSSESPVDVAGLGARISDVAVGQSYACALTTDGAVKCWGFNGYGQLGEGGPWSTTPVDIVGLGPGVRAIATGLQHVCALTAIGGVRCWGTNSFGALGDGSQTSSGIPVDVVGLNSGVVAIQTGSGYSCALMTEGAVKCWGRNYVGQLGDGTNTDRTTPVNVVGLSAGVTAIATGMRHTCAVTGDGRVKCWGSNGSGVFGDGSGISSPTPVDATSMLVPAIAVAVGSSHTCARSVDGAVWCWGSNAYGKLGDGTTISHNTAGQVSGLDSVVAELASGMGHNCVSLIDEELKCWGDGQYGKLGNGVPVRRLTAVQVSALGTQATAISNAWYHSCALSSDGSMECWGSNQSGELGDGTVLPHANPAFVDSLDSGIESIATASSGFVSCAVTLGSRALCWGRNTSGELGDGTFDNRSQPVEVSNLGASVDTLALGGVHGCALTIDGGVQCWGDNYSRQLGDGTKIGGRPMPGPVTGLTSGISAIAAGGFHSCALSLAGQVKCWGANTSGQLGDGTTTTPLSPVAVVGLESGVIAIAAGGNRACALLDSSVVKCWGSGQLTPVAIAGLGAGTTAIAVGNLHACALVGGIAKCWGSNWSGQLGDGTDADREMPVDVVGLDAHAVSISAGHETSCAITESGTAWCWGSNRMGQLGNGEAGFSLVPQTVVGTPFGIFRNGFE